MIFPTHIVAVAGLIRNELGQVLLLKNPRRGWEFPGGQVEVGENLIDALVREIEEETGIIASVGRLVGVYSSIKTDIQYDGVSLVPTKVIMDFLGTALGGQLRTSSESLEVGWYDQELALSMITHPTILERAKVMLSQGDRVLYRAYTNKPYTVYEERWV